MSRTADLTLVARTVVDTVQSERITFLAASLAYYAFVSTMPLLLLVVVVGTALAGDAFAATVVEQLGAVLSPTGEELLANALSSASGRGGATLFGVGVLLWGALKLFRGLSVAFAEVYGTSDGGSLLGQVTDALAALVAVGVGLSVAVAANAVISLLDLPLVRLVGAPALALALTLTFLPLYVLLPDPSVSPRKALPGAVLAGVGWTLLGTGFRVYAENAGGFQIYGVLGGVLLLVTWFYLGGIVLLVGGVLNAVLADRLDERNRQLQLDRYRRSRQRMTDDTGGHTSASGRPGEATDADGPDSHDYADELAELRADLEAFEDDIENRTVHREEIERELKEYVRRRQRRGHATGWGPYLVLLYGTAMTIGAFYFLGGGWAVLAMVIVWLSTLGLYALMLIVGMGVTAAGLPGRLRDAVSGLRR